MVKPSDLTSKIDIPAGISPINDASQYPTHYSDFGFGGLRTVDTIAERDAIADLRRVRGMLVYIVSEQKYYQLLDGIANSNWTELQTGGSQGRLEVIVINNSGADLIQYNAYSLEDNAYTLSDNTVTLTSTRTGLPTQGQTALFFCQDAIANGATGIGVIKGMVTTTVLASVDAERDLKVLPTGSLSDIILDGEYVVATVTRSPLADSPLEIAFDGLSNYKFVIGGFAPDPSTSTGTNQFIRVNDGKTAYEFIDNPEPEIFVKSTSIDGGKSVSFLDQDNTLTTFVPEGGTGIGLTEIDFIIADWTETDAPSGAIIVDITHNLNELNITVDWYETGLDGNAFVPWESISTNAIRGCIPKGTFSGSDTGNAFAGQVRITAFIEPDNTSNIEGARISFNSQTTGTGASWVETATDSGIFTLTLTHGLNTNQLEYSYYIDNITPNFIAAKTLSTTELIIEVAQANLFAGSVFITKVT